MNSKQEVIKIELEKQKVTKNNNSPKIALRIKSEKQDIFIYNGANKYLVQTVLKELSDHVS